MLLSYMRFIVDNSLWGEPYFPKMAMSSAWLEVSQALNGSVNVTHVGRLCLCLRGISFFIVNVPY